MENKPREEYCTLELGDLNHTDSPSLMLYYSEMHISLDDLSDQPLVTLPKKYNIPDSDSKRWLLESHTCCKACFSLFLLALTKSMCDFPRARAAHVGPGRPVLCVEFTGVPQVVVGGGCRGLSLF